jgi:hypothetical protein
VLSLAVSSTDVRQNVNTVDVIFPAWPIWLYLNRTLLLRT